MVDKKRHILCCMLFFLLAATAWSQLMIGSPPQSIIVDVTIPPILKLSIDNTINNAIAIAARYVSPDTNVPQTPVPPSGFFIFDMKPGAVFPIGTIRVFSNMIGFYSVRIETTNHGQLTAMDGQNTARVPYSILLGAATLGSDSGDFLYQLSGKTDQEGDEFLLSLALGAFPENLPSGIYYDKLILSLSKE